MMIGSDSEGTRTSPAVSGLLRDPVYFFLDPKLVSGNR